MPAINRLPLGLLGFLGIKNGGRYPQDLADVLAPTWDLSQLYLNTNSETRSDVVALNALGSQAFVTVPTGEAWIVLLASAATGTLGAGVTFEIGLQTTDAAGLVTIAVSPMSGARTVGQRVAVSLPQPILLGPGSTFGVNVTQLAAGPVSTTLATRFARLSL